MPSISLRNKEKTNFPGPRKVVENLVNNLSYVNFADMKYSFIIPVYNRPDEVDELLESMCTQTLHDFEVVIVEDGSSIPCKEVVDR